MTNRLITIVLGIGLLAGIVMLGGALGQFNLPSNQQGYEPTQPLAYSHRLHAGDLEMPCLYCHFGAEKSRHAGIPSASTCMNCHRFVTATLGAVRAEDDLAKKENRSPRRIVSQELQKLYDALALDANMKPDPAKRPRPIAWAKVNNVPDFAFFDHRPHITSGVTCQTCHGPIETMERVRQVPDLTMGWCVNCHRDSNRTGINGRAVAASLDCAACHF